MFGTPRARIDEKIREKICGVNFRVFIEKF